MGTWHTVKALPEPHPVLGCYHTEGAVLDGFRIVRWLPPMHSCQYVDQRNAALEAKTLTIPKPVRPIGR